MAEISPIVIAYDGSPPSRAAVHAAGRLFAPAPAIVLTVWEPGLAEMMLMPDATGMGSTMLPFDPSVTREVEQASQKHAQSIAEEGATLAREAGLDAQPLAVEDLTDPPDAIVAAAEEHDARAIVIGSRGLGGLKSKLLGSTSKGVLRRAASPVVVVRHADEHGGGHPDERGGHADEHGGGHPDERGGHADEHGGGHADEHGGHSDEHGGHAGKLADEG
jgi:nucleotide-binding universal stress UspA family protein